MNRSPSTTFARRGALLGALLLGGAFAFAQPAAAQAASPSPDEIYDQAFQNGITTLEQRQLDVAIRMFKTCVRIKPKNPTAYYNLACAYSLKKDAEQTASYLRQAFERGFRDLAHMGRDLDLDPVRRELPVRKAYSEFEAKVLEGIEPAFVHKASDPNAPVLVWVTESGADPSKDFRHARETFPEWTIVVPRGAAKGSATVWDESAEWIVQHRLLDVLGERRAPKDVIVAGQGHAGRLALSVAVNNPGLVRNALVSGPFLHAGVSDSDMSGTRAYLVVSPDPQHEASGVIARDAFAKDGLPVVLERASRTQALRDAAILRRGAAWLRGEQVELPGAGETRNF